jgi:KDO2-lipid IV(A) lauroyltransferase
MKSGSFAWLFSLAARLPLRALHRLGAVLGWLAFRLSNDEAGRLVENLYAALPERSADELNNIKRANITAMGEAACELPWVWQRPLDTVLGAVQQVHGWELVEQAQAQGKGVIMLTPHLGCFEIIPLYVGSRTPMTIMYRVPKLTWLDPIIRKGRERGGVKLVRADMSGVRALFKALKRGEVIGILPDQVPGNGEGEWANFFGRPAYTMTLVAKFFQASAAPMLLMFGERLPHGAGYAIHVEQINITPEVSIVQQINTAQEKLIRQYPAQYLWSYNRYKTPAGVNPPPARSEYA